MTPDNYFIADQFSLLSKLMEIHGENSFKAKSYSIAAFNIEKLPVQIATIPREEIFAIKGIGEATGKKIIDILDTGELRQLKELILKTPPGILEMLQIKGIGPKKIATIWKEMEIESIGELLYACNENRLTLFKGFGEKTQHTIRESIEFYLRNQGSYLYAEAEMMALRLDKELKETYKESMFELTGEFRRQLEVINQLEWVTTASLQQLEDYFQKKGISKEEAADNSVRFKSAEGFQLIFHLSPKEQFFRTLIETSCSNEFLDCYRQQDLWHQLPSVNSEDEFFSHFQQIYIPPYQREKAGISPATGNIVQITDIKGIIHSHSNWSDGSQSIEDMAKACITQGFEYLVISDHSKSAFYAKGLYEERVREQHLYIDELNTKLAPFKIFKSIESDILNDGSLDYPDEVLASFDLVIASIHSNLKMSEEKAMMRLLKAIENPYTTILGHLTGRLLLSRNGYPVDHKKIIDACAANKVVIELNAHPRRLDIDWRWIDYAMEKDVLLSVNPDAHNTDGFLDIKYGVLAAQKGGLTKEKNLSSFSLDQFEAFLKSLG